MDLQRLPVELVEILNKIKPNDDEQKKFDQFTKDKKNPKSLPENDKFLFEVCFLDNPPSIMAALHTDLSPIPNWQGFLAWGALFRRGNLTTPKVTLYI